jgi:capsular polysaccharide export protein
LPFSFLERGLFSDSLFIDNEGVNGASSLCTTKAGSWSSESYSENLHDFCKKIFFKKDDKKYNKPKEFNSKRLIFFPLQVQLDTNIIYYSPFKTMREAFIRIYEKFNDESTFFVVRPHPEEVEDFKVNLPVYNNIIISSDNSLEYWIDVSDVVVTINSTVGLEALLKNKKVVCIGESIYSGLSSINKFKDDKQIECDSHEVLNYLCFLIENNLIKSDSLYSHSVASKIIDFAEINVKKEIYFEKYKKFSSACFEGKKSLNVSLDFDFSSKLDLTYRKNNHPVSVDYLRKMLKEKLGDFEFNFINDKSSKFDIKIVDDKINYKHVDDHSVVIDYYGAFKYIEGLGVI